MSDESEKKKEKKEADIKKGKELKEGKVERAESWPEPPADDEEEK